MSKRAHPLAAGKLVAVVVAVVSLVAAGGLRDGLSAGPSADAAVRAGSSGYSIGLWGDMPYARAGDAAKIPALIRDMNAYPLAFSVFIGDIKDGSSRCDDSHFVDAIARFNTFDAPMIYVPGDNEWTDCHRTNNGGFNNLERLDFLRRTMYPTVESFGRRRMTVEHQGPVGGPYVENMRWVRDGVLYVVLNVPGSNNNKVNSPAACTNASARTQADCDADNAEYAARDAANITWLRQSFQMAKAGGAAGVMILTQADPGFDLPETEETNERENPAYDGYTNFLDAVVGETRAFSGQVLLVHGDTHFFKLDKPLVSQANLVQNFTRLELFGSPNIHWVRVDVDASRPSVFTVIPMLVPGN